MKIFRQFARGRSELGHHAPRPLDLLRRAVFAVTATIILATVGAVSGVGSSAAQAYDLAVSQDAVTLHLTGEETFKAAHESGWEFTDSLCTQANSDLEKLSGSSAPIDSSNCDYEVWMCSRLAQGYGIAQGLGTDQPATVVFNWDRVDCEGAWDAQPSS